MNIGKTLEKHKGVRPTLNHYHLIYSFSIAAALGLSLRLIDFDWMLEGFISQAYFNYILAWAWLAKICIRLLLKYSKASPTKHSSFEADLWLTLVCLVVVFCKEQLYIIVSFRLSGYFISILVASHIMQKDAYNLELGLESKWPILIYYADLAYHLFAAIIIASSYHTIPEICLSVGLGGYLIISQDSITRRVESWMFARERPSH